MPVAPLCCKSLEKWNCGAQHKQKDCHQTPGQTFARLRRRIFDFLMLTIFINLQLVSRCPSQDMASAAERLSPSFVFDVLELCHVPGPEIRLLKAWHRLKPQNSPTATGQTRQLANLFVPVSRAWRVPNGKQRDGGTEEGASSGFADPFSGSSLSLLTIQRTVLEKPLEAGLKKRHSNMDKFRVTTSIDFFAAVSTVSTWPPTC